jgi:hypothetical protein
MAIVRTTIGDLDSNPAFGTPGHNPNPSTQWQSSMCSGQVMRVKALTIGHPPADMLTAVKAGYTCDGLGYQLKTTDQDQ